MFGIDPTMVLGPGRARHPLTGAPLGDLARRDCLELLRQNLGIGDLVVFLCIGILCGVAVVYAVNVLCKKNDIRIDLSRPEGSAGIGGEIGIAGAAAEHHHPALFQMPAGLGADIGLGNGPHLDGGLYPDLHIPLLQ